MSTHAEQLYQHPSADPQAQEERCYETIQFNYGRQARMVRISAADDPAKTLYHLQLPQPKAWIMLSGGADLLEDERKPRLKQLFSRGIARAAVSMEAGFIDGGTDSGIMAMLGQGSVERGHKLPLLGVAPELPVTWPGQDPENTAEDVTPLEPNHSHFVLVENQTWGGEVGARYALAERLAKNVPMVTVLVNGGKISCEEILRSVRLGSSIIVVEGSGRLADQIAELYRNPPEFIEDPMLAEIIEEGDIHLFSITGKVAELERLIYRHLRGDTSLKLAWEQFALYDHNATCHQQGFRRIQMAIIMLGVLGTALALFQTTLSNQADYLRQNGLSEQVHVLRSHASPETLSLSTTPQPIQPEKHGNLITEWLEDWFIHIEESWLVEEDASTGNHSELPMEQRLQMESARYREQLIATLENIVALFGHIIILIPIISTALLAAANRFNAGTKWLLLRGSAEALKREIYRYRSHAEIYSSLQTAAMSREIKLANKVQNITRQLMQTEVNLSSLKRYQGPIPPKYGISANDDGMSNLNPEQYLTARLEDQLNYYQSKTTTLEKRLKRLQWMIYGIGGVSTLLAAMGMELWIALTTALVTAISTYMEYQQIETTLVKYNQAANDLANVRSWWIALSAAEQEKQSDIDMLVRQTERILHSEFSGWVQEMQDALSMLKEYQRRAAEEERLQKEKDASPADGNATPAANANKSTSASSEANKNSDNNMALASLESEL